MAFFVDFEGMRFKNVYQVGSSDQLVPILAR